MERIPHGDGLESPSYNARKLNGHADGRCSARCKENLVQIAGSEAGELLRKAYGGNVGVAPGAEREKLHLLLDRRKYVRICEAHLVYIIPMEIHVPASFKIFEVDAFRLSQHIQARRGKRLAQKELFVFFKPELGIGAYVLLAPGLPMRRDIQVPFGPHGVKRIHLVSHWRHPNSTTIKCV